MARDLVASTEMPVFWTQILVTPPLAANATEVATTQMCVFVSVLSRWDPPPWGKTAEEMPSNRFQVFVCHMGHRPTTAYDLDIGKGT